MKKILSLLLCAVLVFTMVTPALAADGDNVLYNLSTASELMKYQFVRATIAEVKGYAGKTDTDSSLHMAVAASTPDPSAYVDFKWGTATADTWDKLSYKGYLVNEFNIINDGASQILMCTDQNSIVSNNLVETGKLKDGEWNKVYVITDRTGGTYNGKTITYINGAIASNWHTDYIGTKHSVSGVYKNALRYLCQGEVGTGMYIDDVRIYETQTMPDLGGDEEPAERTDIITSTPDKVVCGTTETVGAVFGKAEGDSVNRITTTETDVNVYYNIGWTPTSMWSKYLVFEVNAAPEENVERFHFGTNGHSAMSSDIYVGKQVKANRWNKLVMVYNIASGKSDVYINGVKFDSDYNATYKEKDGNVLRFVSWRNGGVTYVDDMKIYECMDYPEIPSQILLKDGFDKGNGIFVDNKNSSMTVMADSSVGDIKALFDGAESVRIYADDSFTAILSDSDPVPSGAVAAICAGGETYSYYTIANYENNSIIVSGSSYDGNSTIGKGTTVFTAMAGSENVLVAAQYDAGGNLIKTALSPATPGIINSIEFEPDRIENSYVKAFLLSDIKSLKPLCPAKKLDYKAPLELLVIGNSFSMDVTCYLHDIAAADGKDMNVWVLNKGGSAVGYHYDNRETSVREIMLWKNNQSVGYTNLKTTLERYDWDIIVMQNWGNSKSFYTYTDSTYSENWSKMADLAAYIHENEPKAKLMIHETWSFESGYSFVTDEATRDEITEGIHTLYAKCAEDCAARIGADKPLEMISSLDAFEAARHHTNDDGVEIFNTSYYKDGHTFTGVKNRATVAVGDGSMMLSPEEAAAGKIGLHRDGFHASAAARYLIALNAYTTLTGKPVSGNTFRPGTIALDSSASYTNEQTDLDNAQSGVIYEKYDPLKEDVVTTLQSISDSIIR